MAKYSYELKRRIVEDYLDGKGGYKTLSRIYGIAQSPIKTWIRAHQALGRESLKEGLRNTRDGKARVSIV